MWGGRIGLVTGETVAVEQVDQFCMLIYGENFSPFGVGSREDGQPASRPAEDGAGTQDPRQPPRRRLVILRAYSSELPGAKSLRCQASHTLVRLLIRATLC